MSVTPIRWNQLSRVPNIDSRQNIKDAINQVVGELNANQTTLTGVGGAGATTGTGGFYETSVNKVGDLVYTNILLDLTGLSSSTTDLDIIGVGASPAYIAQVTSQNGTVVAIRCTCLEAPAGGVADIDLYSAVEGTGVFDGAIGSLTGTALITSGGAWTSGRTLGSTAVPANNRYLYLTGGAAGTAAAYTAGKFLIELIGQA